MRKSSLAVVLPYACFDFNFNQLISMSYPQEANIESDPTFESVRHHPTSIQKLK